MTHSVADGEVKLCERSGCTKGAGGAPGAAIGSVDGRWYCAKHLPAAKAVATKRKDKGFGACSVPGCSRPAAEKGGKCVEHRAGERAAGAPRQLIEGKPGKGAHPYAPKPADVYLVVFPDVGLLKVGKATPWTVHSRVKAAAAKLFVRETDSGIERPVAGERHAWAVGLFDEEPVLWAVAERVEHAAAGRLALNAGCGSVDHTKGKEWLACRQINEIDWPAELHRAVRETLEFLGYPEGLAGEPRVIE
jgi:hypothetical protein